MDPLLKEALNASSPVLVGIVIMIVLAALRAIPHFPNWLLPFTGFLIGMTAYPLLEGWSPRNFLLGIVIGGFPVGLHQGWKQFVERKEQVKSGDTQWLSRDKVGRNGWPVAALAIFMVVLMTGCASINQAVRREVTYTDGTVEVWETKNKVVAVWDAKNTIEKTKLTNGKTQSIGTSGIENEASSTNIVAGLREVRGIVEALAKKAGGQ